MVSFFDRFQEIAIKLSPFCFGIDPIKEILNAWGLEDNIHGLRKFCRIIKNVIVDNGSRKVGIIKPQLAFFERFGLEGIKEVVDLISYAKDQDILTILDCKKTDIGHTAYAYLESTLEKSCFINADAITFSPYLGVGIFNDDKFIKIIDDNDAFIFIIVKSSNPEGKMIQDAKIDDGRKVSEYLADQICEYNQKSGKLFGAVIGATKKKKEIETILYKLNGTLILSPGIGAQGASYQDIASIFNGYYNSIIPTSSRGILMRGPKLCDLKSVLGEEMKISKATLIKT